MNVVQNYASLDIRNVSAHLTRRHGDSLQDNAIVADFSFQINKPEIVALLGPNGSGKSTLLRLIAGLLLNSKGSIAINGRKPSESRIGMMFQNYRDTLFPWFTAQRNLEITSGEWNSSVDDSQCRDISLSVLGDHFPLHAKPGSLSGGQQQRLCLARAMSSVPDILLFDEPYSALDHQSKVHCQALMEEFALSQKLPLLLVTHDIHDAIILADRILVCSGPPLKIADDIPIPLGRPRSYQMFEDNTSVCWQIEARIFKALRHEV